MRRSFYTLVILLTVQCTSSRFDGVVEPINVWDGCEEVVDLATRCDDIQIIPLIKDGNPVLMAFSPKIIVNEPQMILLSGGRAISFDLEGNYVIQYGNIGRGPGEYIHISDVCLSSDKRFLLCLSSQNEIYRYDVMTGDFVDKVSTSISGITATAIMPGKDGKISLFFPNPMDPSSEDDFFCVKDISPSGSVVAESIQREDFNVSLGFNTPAHQIYENNYVLSFRSASGYCYVTTPDGLVPFVDIMLGKNGAPSGYALDGGNPWMKVAEFFEADMIKCPSLLTTKDYFYCSMMGKESSVWNCVLPKDGRQGFRWESKGNLAPPMMASCSDEQYFYFVYSEPMTVDDQTQDIFQKLIREKYTPDNKIGDDASYIVKIRFK